MMEEYQDQSLRGKVFQKIREEILSGVYQDGEELREVTLGEKLGVSRTPGARGTQAVGAGRSGNDRSE